MRVGWIPQDTFAARLLLARRHLGLSVKDAAARCHIHYATWSTWERGSVPQNYPDIVQRVSEGLGVNRDWLAWGGVLATTPTSSGSTPSDQVTYVTKRYRIGSVRDIRPNLSRSDIVHSPSATSPKRPRTGFRAYPDTRACQKLAS